MNGAWYWYVAEGPYGTDNAVRIHAEEPGAVRGRYWVIPAQDHDYRQWRVYLQPRWYVERDTPGVNSARGNDCEWVFVKRERWKPPPKEPIEYTTDICECCGQEVQT
jgi:hypothetical protein